MTQFITRAYNSFNVDHDSGQVITKKSKESRLYNEINYYKNLPNEISIFFPRFLGYEKLNDEYHMHLEYYAYDNLGYFMVDKQYDSGFWDRVFNSIQKYIDTYGNFKKPYGKSDITSMYIDKTQNEYINLTTNFDFFKEINKEKFLYLNGEELLNFNEIWPTIKNHIDNITFSDNFYLIHGDFCFSNILCGVNRTNGDVIIKNIDPRGTFGSSDFYGDFYYDLAKLSHSCSGGYEYFINDRFSIHVDDNRFTLSFDNLTKEKINNNFIKFVDNNGYDIERIKLLEGTIFVGMCARHYDSLDRQKAMYITGIKILNDIYKKIITT